MTKHRSINIFLIDDDPNGIRVSQTNARSHAAQKVISCVSSRSEVIRSKRMTRRGAGKNRRESIQVVMHLFNAHASRCSL